MKKMNFISGPLAGAAFLMATSAIGPGFITQTTKFTDQLKASFGFVILVSIILDIGVQLNIWRIINISKMYAQDLANKVFPGAGYFLSILIIGGGLAFNIGNIAGAGLGLQVLTGCSVKMGAAVSCMIAIVLFLFKETGAAMDNFAKALGFIMIALSIYVAIQSEPPLQEAVLKTFHPDHINEIIILTIVGGTVGGYISFAGAHRLLEAGITGKENIRSISQSSVSAILIAAVMRIVLFLAALGIVWKGISLNPENPAATVFQQAAGQLGYRLFGLVLWSASITSVVGSAFTSVTFARVLHTGVKDHFRSVIILFILFSTAIFLTVGQPVKVLIMAGAINGMILPIALALMLLAIHKKNIGVGYKHPLWLSIAGWLVVLLLGYMAVKGFLGFF